MEELPPSQKDLVVTRRCRRSCELRGQTDHAWRISLSPVTRQIRKSRDQIGQTDSGLSDTDSNHRYWSLATVARHAVVTSSGAAQAPAQKQPHPPGRSNRQFSTEGLQRLQARVDLIIQDMNAVNRSCSSETAADFQPTDETLDLRGPPLTDPFSISLTPKYRPDTKPDSPLAFSAPQARLTSPRNRKRAQYDTKKAEMFKKAKASPNSSK